MRRASETLRTSQPFQRRAHRGGETSIRIVSKVALEIGDRAGGLTNRRKAARRAPVASPLPRSVHQRSREQVIEVLYRFGAPPGLREQLPARDANLAGQPRSRVPDAEQDRQRLVRSPQRQQRLDSGERGLRAEAPRGKATVAFIQRSQSRAGIACATELPKCPCQELRLVG